MPIILSSSVMAVAEVEPGGHHLATPRFWGLRVQCLQRKGCCHGYSVGDAWPGRRLREPLSCARQSPRSRPDGIDERPANPTRSTRPTIRTGPTRPNISAHGWPGRHRISGQPTPGGAGIDGRHGRVRARTPSDPHGHLRSVRGSGRPRPDAHARIVDCDRRRGRLAKGAKNGSGPSWCRPGSVSFCRVGAFVSYGDCRRWRREASPSRIARYGVEPTCRPDQ